MRHRLVSDVHVHDQTAEEDAWVPKEGGISIVAKALELQWYSHLSTPEKTSPYETAVRNIHVEKLNLNFLHVFRLVNVPLPSCFSKKPCRGIC
jgi:hypothetical protein